MLYKKYISYIWFYASGTGKEPPIGQETEHLDHQQPETDPQQAHHRLGPANTQNPIASN